MNTSSLIQILCVAFLCNVIAVHAFVGLPSEIPNVAELFRMSSISEDSNTQDPLLEEVWRYAKKPLLSVGGKGATNKHGNSLRQLLDDHTVVKVKVNTKSFGSLEKAYTSLRDLAIESGASDDIELIQMREKDRTIMFGLPGTLENVENGSFPPPPPEPVDVETVL